MRLTVTCQPCGERNRLERPITTPGQVYLMCVKCETPLKCEVTEEQLTKPSKKPFVSSEMFTNGKPEDKPPTPKNPWV